MNPHSVFKSTYIPTFFAQRNIHYGWIIVAVTFLTMLITAGALGAPGVFIVPLQKEFGWSASQVSSAIAIRLVLFGLMGPFAAAFMNRFGIRTITITALSIIMTGLLLSLMMSQLWQLILLWGIVVGFGTGLTALVLGATIAARWFTKRRGLVMGLLTASSATGQLVFLPLIATLTEHFGWRTSLTCLCSLFVIAIAAIVHLMRDYPADVGLAPYGSENQAIIKPPAPSPLSPFAILAEAAHSRTFWVLFGTFFVCGASTNGLIQTHFIPLCSDKGLAAVTAAGVLAMMGVFDFIGTVLSGWLSDRYSNKWLLFWYYGLRGLSLLYLPYAHFSFYGLSLFAMFYGLDWIATVPPTVKLVSEHFGEEKAGLTFGWIFAAHQLGAAVAAFGGGLSRTIFSSYFPAFYSAGALCLIASLAALTLQNPTKGLSLVNAR
ncbi:MAG: MFS transporter [Pseudomonadota bacterium]